MFRSYTWPSSGDVPCTMLLSALLLRHNFTWVCGRIFYLCCCHVYLSAVGLVVVFKSNKLNACDILLRSNVIHIMQIKYSWKKKKTKRKKSEVHLHLNDIKTTVAQIPLLYSCGFRRELKKWWKLLWNLMFLFITVLCYKILTQYLYKV